MESPFRSLPLFFYPTQKVATTRFILPCIENTLVDAREAVVARGLRCLASLAGLGLLPRYALPAQAKSAAPLLQHPGIAVRAGAVELCVRAAEALGPLDTQVFLHPVLRPHLRYVRYDGELIRSPHLSFLSSVSRYIAASPQCFKWCVTSTLAWADSVCPIPESRVFSPWFVGSPDMRGREMPKCFDRSRRIARVLIKCAIVEYEVGKGERYADPLGQRTRFNQRGGREGRGGGALSTAN